MLAAEWFGKEGTEQEKGVQRALEMHRHATETLTFLTALLELCQGQVSHFSLCIACSTAATPL